ncbi:nucleoside triphosphate pyrophosphohydrolase [soil metagenome]
MDRTRRLSLLVTSPRVAPGLLSRQAWQALDAAQAVWCRSLDDPLALALAENGVALLEHGESSATALATELLRQAHSGAVVWVGSPDADPGLTDALAHPLAADEDPPELEIVVGSWDTPGSRLLDAVAVMDRLRSPGGCPWDAQQTHESLTPYLIEEAYECVEALEVGTLEHRIEELGDVLLQVLFHARVAQESDDESFDVDDVAGVLVDKLIRRHPHVFAGASADTAADVEASWQQIKAEERPGREHPLDGIPAGMPDLARAGKVVSRLTRAGHLPWLREQVDHVASGGQGEDQHAAALLQQVLDADTDGVDAASALRGLLREIESASRDHQQ